MCIFGTPASAIDLRLRGPEADCWIKCKGLHAILQQQLHIREHTPQFADELGGFKLVLIDTDWARSRASLGLVAYIRRGNNEQAFLCKEACTFIEKSTIIRQMFDYFKRGYKIIITPLETVLPYRMTPENASQESSSLREHIESRRQQCPHPSPLRRIAQVRRIPTLCRSPHPTLAYLGHTSGQTRSVRCAHSKGHRSLGPE